MLSYVLLLSSTDVYENPKFPGGISGEGFVYRAPHFGRDFPVTTSQRIKVSKVMNDYFTQFLAGTFYQSLCNIVLYILFHVKAAIF